MKILLRVIGLFLGLLVSSDMGFAQNEQSYWYFGKNAGLKFDNIASCGKGERSCSDTLFYNARVLSDGALDTQEGAASVADIAGNLLFYTNGITVWDKNHQAMPNGQNLAGDLTSTQSALIVNLPRTCIYYIFTAGQGAKNDLRYSMVDMRLNGGKGDITSKNILLSTKMTEKITAVRHANQLDYWLISHEADSDQFKVFLISGQTGVQTTPIISKIGSTHQGICGSIGYMKANFAGNRLALAVSNCAQATPQDRVELFNFNNANGVISNLRSDLVPNAYGIEFSPNDQFLYVSVWFGGLIYQYDLSNGLNTKKNAGKTTP
ncbi:MAG: selenium-binding family protein [Microscillaceae bacterium]|jgi:hypothetical protein|nr:selenium-binding family protein [Microscillaceae bacterium]